MLDAHTFRTVPIPEILATPISTMYTFLNSPEAWLDFLDTYVNDTSPGANVLSLYEHLIAEGQRKPIEIHTSSALTDGHHRLALAILCAWDSIDVAYWS